MTMFRVRLKMRRNNNSDRKSRRWWWISLISTSRWWCSRSWKSTAKFSSPWRNNPCPSSSHHPNNKYRFPGGTPTTSTSLPKTIWRNLGIIPRNFPSAKRISLSRKCRKKMRRRKGRWNRRRGKGGNLVSWIMFKLTFKIILKILLSIIYQNPPTIKSWKYSNDLNNSSSIRI